MKIIVLSYILLFNFAFSQEFNAGYNDGWPIGYCYDAQLGCIAPITPIAPLPKIGESSNSYMDGYHRGLADGINKGKSDKKQNNKSNLNTYQSYSVPQYIPEFKPFTPDYDFYSNALNRLQSSYNQKSKSKTDPEMEKIVEWVNFTTSASEVEKRKNLMKFVNTQYNNFDRFPTLIPDGFYNAYFINDTKWFFKKFFKNELHEDDCQIRQVFVQNNKIIWTKYKFNFEDYFTEFDPDIFPNVYNMRITLKSNKIQNGLCYVTNSTYDNSDPDARTHKELSSVNSRYYFIEFLTEYNETQKMLDEVQKKYHTADKNKTISDGWHICYLTDRLHFFGSRNVYVNNKKIIKWIASDGNEVYVDTGGEIKDLKATLTRKYPAPELNEKQKIFWKNTNQVNPKVEIYDAYFINL